MSLHIGRHTSALSLSVHAYCPYVRSGQLAAARDKHSVTLDNLFAQSNPTATAHFTRTFLRRERVKGHFDGEEFMTLFLPLHKRRYRTQKNSNRLSVFDPG